MIIETKQLIISKELKRKVELICRFANAKYTLINGNIKSIKNTNIANVRPHNLRVKETDYLIFEECYRFVETVTHYAIGKANNGLILFIKIKQVLSDKQNYVF